MDIVLFLYNAFPVRLETVNYIPEIHNPLKLHVSAKLKSIKVKYQNTSNVVVYYVRPTEIIYPETMMHVTSVQYTITESKIRLTKMFDVYFHFVQRI